ncbi:unnamed protein product, partial [Iphiclides podalirius]
MIRSRQSNSSSPVRRVTHVRSLSPTIVGTLSPPLCNSPVRNNAQLLNSRREDGASQMTVSVGDSKELSDDGEKLSRKKRPGCDKWMGSIRALRDSHLRLVMRQLRQFRQIERLSRSLKQK